MPEITGLHHVALPATNALRSSEWYERVFGFSSVLVEEEENEVISVTLEHPSGIVLTLHQADDHVHAWEELAPLALEVSDQTQLARWDHWLTRHQITHSTMRPAHLGWALDVSGPDGFRIQLHTRPVLSGDDR